MSIYDKTVIEELNPALRQKAQLIDVAYQARALFDQQMQEAYDFELKHNGEDNAKAVLEDADTIRMSKNEAMQEASEAITAEISDTYSIDVQNSTPDIMVVKDNATGKVFMVMHGASSGDANTITGRQINNLDIDSAFRSHLPVSNKTGQRYPELDSVAENLIDVYGHENVSTVVYSNSGPKGLYLNKEWKIPTTGFDPVIGTAQSGDMRAGLPAEAHFVKTTKFSVGMDAGKITNPVRNVSDPVVTNPTKNVKITTIAPLAYGEDNPKPTSILQTIKDGHSIDQFSADAPRQQESGEITKVNFGKTATGFGASLGAGLGAGIAVEKGLEAVGSHNVVVNTAISGAAGGGVGQAAQNLAVKGMSQLAESTGMAATEAVSTSITEGILTSAVKGGAGALVALPIQYGIQTGLEKAGLDRFAAMPISGAIGGAVAGGTIEAASILLAEEGAANWWNPVGWASLAMAGVGGAVSGGFAIAGKVHKDRMDYLGHKFLSNQKDLNNFDETGGLSTKELKELTEGNPEFVDWARSALEDQQHQYRQTVANLNRIESRLVHNVKIGEYVDPSDPYFSKTVGVVHDDQHTYTNVDYMHGHMKTTLVDATRDDIDYLKANDPTFFDRMGQFISLATEEYKYATKQQTAKEGEKILSQAHEDRIRREDPTFFDRIYKQQHPDDPNHFDDVMSESYQSPWAEEMNKVEAEPAPNDEDER